MTYLPRQSSLNPFEQVVVSDDLFDNGLIEGGEASLNPFEQVVVSDMLLASEAWALHGVRLNPFEQVVVSDARSVGWTTGYDEDVSIPSNRSLFLM